MSYDTNNVKEQVEAEYKRDEQTVDASEDMGMMSIAFCALTVDESSYSFF